MSGSSGSGRCRCGEVLRSRILQPLGMTQTAFFTTEASRLATAYINTADGLIVWDGPDGDWALPPAFDDGAAGLVSTVDDLLAFARMFLRAGASVLSPDSVKEMTRDQLSPAQREGQEAFLATARGGCASRSSWPATARVRSAGKAASGPRSSSTRCATSPSSC
jgi:CubicO group peptidase (beta-lactamase class C family)